MSEYSGGIGLVIFGGVETCQPSFTLTDTDNYTNLNNEYSDWRRYRILDPSGYYHYHNMNSFGTTWNSGVPLGSHFYLQEGSGVSIVSHDSKYSGTVIAALGSGTQPIWLFNNQKIAGQKAKLNGSGSYDVAPVLPAISGMSFTYIPYSSVILPSITINFLVTPAQIPSIPDDSPEDNGGGGTGFLFYIGATPYTTNPTIATVEIGNAGVMATAAQDIADAFNTQGPWVSSPLSVVGVTGTSMTFTTNSNSAVPDTITANSDYLHYTTGALYGPYDDDFNSSIIAGSTTIGSYVIPSGGYDYGTSSSDYKGLFHNQNCLRLGLYDINGQVSPTPIFNPETIFHVSGNQPLPHGDFSLVVLYNDYSNNKYYLSNYERVFNSGYYSTALFGDYNSIEVSLSGSAHNYPTYIQSIRYRNSLGAYTTVSGGYNVTTENSRFIGQMLSYQNSGLYLYNISNSGTVYQSLSTTNFARYPSGDNFCIRPNCIWGLREVIIRSGSVITPTELQEYLRNPANKLSTNNNVSAFTLNSGHLIHRAPNTVGHLYSGDISYAVADTLLIIPEQRFSSLPSGNNLTLDLIVHYSGTGNCYIQPWVEITKENQSYTWTPSYNGYGVQPSTNTRGLEILTSSGLHKVSFQGPHKVDSSGALYQARTYLNLSFSENQTSYSGGDFRLYSAKLYSDNGVCYANLNDYENMNLWTQGAYTESSGTTLYASGGLAPYSGSIPLYMTAPTTYSSGLPFVVSGAIFQSSGIPLFISGLSTAISSFSLYTVSTVYSGSNSVPLFTFSNSSSGLYKGLDLYLDSVKLNQAISLYVHNTDSNSTPSSYIPLYLEAQDNIVRNYVNLYLESVKQNSGELKLYIRGYGLSDNASFTSNNATLFINNTDLESGVIFSSSGVYYWNPLISSAGFLGFNPEETSGIIPNTGGLTLFMSAPTVIPSSLPLFVRVSDSQSSGFYFYTFGF